MALPGLAAAVAGILFAQKWRKGPASSEVTPLTGFGATWTWLFDSIYEVVWVKPTYFVAKMLRNVGDEIICSGAVRGVKSAVAMMSCGYRGFQRGQVRISLLASTIGIIAVVLYTLWGVLFVG